MTSPVKLATRSGHEGTATSSPYMSRLTLNGKTHYACNFCKINFLNITCCIRHIRIHTGEKPFSCSYCNKSFSRKYAPEIHERVHTGKKPFSCSYCNQTFARKYTAQAHENLHTGEKPYRCDVCGISFPSSSHLNYHRKQKTNIACSVSRSKGTRSNLSSNTTSNLNVRSVQRRQIATETNTSSEEIATVKNVKVQTGDRPYTCKYSYCKKAFSIKHNAKAHEKTHLGVNSFYCNVCSKGFRSHSGLKYHLTHSSKQCKHSNDILRADDVAVQVVKPVLPLKSIMSKTKQRIQEGQD